MHEFQPFGFPLLSCTGYFGPFSPDDPGIYISLRKLFSPTRDQKTPACGTRALLVTIVRQLFDGSEFHFQGPLSYTVTWAQREDLYSFWKIIYLVPAHNTKSDHS